MHARDKFGFFDPDQPYTVTYARLPHWEQEGATYFITFRTADSLPIAVMDRWNRERKHWLSRRGVSADRPDWHKSFAALTLMAGRVVCGRCGRRMSISYSEKSNARFTCDMSRNHWVEDDPKNRFGASAIAGSSAQQGLTRIGHPQSHGTVVSG